MSSVRKNKPLVMDNRFFVLSLILIGMLALYGIILLPVIGIFGLVGYWRFRYGQT